ncbi:MAG: hypothetical protein KAJ17_02585, partial [Candidatus Krumholzibacteria bacterium]|nr:hypothetical protein [Candidatus Krumholzibacteria bacterium]
GGGPSSDSPVITVRNADEYEIVYVSGNAAGDTVGGTQVLKADVFDRYGNTVPGAVVTFLLVPAGGPDGTAFIRDAVYDTTDGITTSDGDGRATATVHTALTAGDNTVKAKILAGSPPLEEVSFTVSTIATIDHYQVITGVAQETAGNSVGITVRALDGAGNLVIDNTTDVILSALPDNAPVWGPNPVTLKAGTLQTYVTLNDADTYTIASATQGDPSTSGESSSLVIVPAAPALTITATATEDTITANSLSTTDITSSVITDAFGNTVAPGELVTVTPSPGMGTIDTPDQDIPREGNQQAVDATGHIFFRLRSSTTTGTSSVSMESAVGSATGSIDIVFADIPAFACDEIPIPSIVIVGDSVIFK